MNIHPYITYKDDCAEAFQTYARIFGGEVVFVQKFSDAPGSGETPPHLADKVMHARVQLGGNILMGSDSFDPDTYASPIGVSVQCGFDDFDKAKAVFDALSEGGEVSMPFAATFWAKGFGMLTDRFGVPWMLNVD